MNCNTCNGGMKDPVYIPHNSAYKAGIFVCSYCGHTETFPKEPSGGKGGAKSDARYGGIRQNKKFSAQHAVASLAGHEHKTVLDVGAGRGDFLNAAIAAWEGEIEDVCGIEPDESLLSSDDIQPIYGGGVTLVHGRVEESWAFGIAAATAPWDIVHLSHTLEHLHDPRAILKKLSTVGKIMYVEVPDMDIIQQPMVEEFFIDRHYHHFTAITLKQMLHASNWRQLDHGKADDAIWAVCAPGGPLKPHLTNEPVRIREMILNYQNNLAATREALKSIVSKINRENGAVVWGAGRIYNQMIASGLKSSIPVIDSYYQDDGVKTPADLAITPKVVVVASRIFKDVITQQARELWPEVEIVYAI